MYYYTIAILVREFDHEKIDNLEGFLIGDHDKGSLFLVFPELIFDPFLFH